MVPTRATCSAQSPKSCLDWECGTVQDDADNGLVCEEGRCLTSARTFCRKSTNGRYHACVNQGDCGSAFFCDIADNTCKTAEATIGHPCVEDLNCVASQYCSNGVCTNRKTLIGDTCTADNQCQTSQWCFNGACASKSAIGANTCANNEDRRCLNSYCSGTACTALVPLTSACTRDEQCAGFCNASNACEDYPATDAPCATNSASETTVCNPSTHFCESNVCKARVSSAGSACHLQSNKCGSSLFCNLFTNTCAAVGANQGHTCDQDSNCASTQYCNASHSCTERVPLNAGPCTADNQCQTTQYC